MRSTRSAGGSPAMRRARRSASPSMRSRSPNTARSSATATPLRYGASSLPPASRAGAMIGLPTETAEAFDHEGEAGALWSPERQQRRELPRVGGVASLRVQPPAERNVAPGIARAHHLSHGDIRRGHIDQ